MEERSIGGITWEAPEHRHIEKGNDWYWALGIITIAATAAAIVLGNTLFGVVLLLGASTMLIFASKKPSIIPFAVTLRGIRVSNQLYPYSTLASYYLDEEGPDGPQLLLKSERMFMPIIVMPIPDEHIDDIDDILASRLPEELLEEPFSERILEFFGF